MMPRKRKGKGKEIDFSFEKGWNSSDIYIPFEDIQKLRIELADKIFKLRIDANTLNNFIINLKPFFEDENIYKKNDKNLKEIVDNVNKLDKKINELQKVKNYNEQDVFKYQKEYEKYYNQYRNILNTSREKRNAYLEAQVQAKKVDVTVEEKAQKSDKKVESLKVGTRTYHETIRDYETKKDHEIKKEYATKKDQETKIVSLKVEISPINTSTHTAHAFFNPFKAPFQSSLIAEPKEKNKQGAEPKEKNKQGESGPEGDMAKSKSDDDADLANSRSHSM